MNLFENLKIIDEDESEITLNIANKWKRAGNIFIANDDSTAESVKTYLKKLNQGE